MNIAVSDLYKMKDVVAIKEEVNGRMIQLIQSNVVDGFEESMDVESLYCSKHCPVLEQKGWAESTAHPPLPNVLIGLKELGLNMKLLLRSHNGSVPLASLPTCYEAEFDKFEIGEGVPLEHLVASVKVSFILIKKNIK